MENIQPQPIFTGLKIDNDKFLVRRRLFSNTNTQVYDVEDLYNPDLRLVIKMKNYYFEKAYRELMVLKSFRRSIIKPIDLGRFANVYSEGFLLTFLNEGVL